MTKKELIDMFSKYDDNAEIITFNRTTNKWFKTGNAANYKIETVGETTSKCNNYGKRQLERFNKNDITFFF